MSPESWILAEIKDPLSDLLSAVPMDQMPDKIFKKVLPQFPIFKNDPHIFRDQGVVGRRHDHIRTAPEIKINRDLVFHNDIQHRIHQTVIVVSFGLSIRDPKIL